MYSVPYISSISSSRNILAKSYLFLFSLVQKYILNKITVLYVHSEKEKELWQNITKSNVIIHFMGLTLNFGQMIILFLIKGIQVK